MEPPLPTPQSVWAGFDPTVGPLEEEILRAWTEDGVAHKEVFFSASVVWTPPLSLQLMNLWLAASRLTDTCSRAFLVGQAHQRRGRSSLRGVRGASTGAGYTRGGRCASACAAAHARWRADRRSALSQLGEERIRRLVHQLPRRGLRAGSRHLYCVP